MLSRLLEGLDNIDLSSLEETRMRAAQLLSKVNWLNCRDEEPLSGTVDSSA